MPKFCRKPIAVTAEQFFPGRAEWPKNVHERFVTGSTCGRDDGFPDGFELRTPRGTERIKASDWVVTDHLGRQEVVGAYDFVRLYIEVEEHPIVADQKVITTHWSEPDDEAVA